MDAKALADAMRYIIWNLEEVQHSESAPPAPDTSAYIGQAIGAAAAVKLQCEQAGKPKTREAGQ